jgi:hypothetical protein
MHPTHTQLIEFRAAIRPPDHRSCPAGDQTHAPRLVPAGRLGARGADGDLAPSVSIDVRHAYDGLAEALLFARTL